MSKCLLVYFSQGGSTARVAEGIAAGLRDSGYEVNLHNLHGNSSPPDPRSFDLLGVGSPVHYFRLPFNVSDYLGRLPDLRGMPVFGFVTWGTYRCEAGDYLRKALSRKGGREVGYFQSKGADLFLPYEKEGYRFSPEHPTGDELSLARTFGLDVAARARGARYVRALAEPRAPFIYRLERFLTGRLFVHLFYSRWFSVDANKCSGCTACERICPTKNIKMNDRGLPAWRQDCTMCLMCEAKCPKDAITSPLSWPIFRPLMMYNVYRASRDPSLTHAHVTHRRGQTIKLGK